MSIQDQAEAAINHAKAHHPQLLGDYEFPQDARARQHTPTRREIADITILKSLPDSWEREKAWFEHLREENGLDLPAEYKPTQLASEAGELIWVEERSGAIRKILSSPHWALFLKAITGWKNPPGTSENSCLIPAHTGAAVDARGNQTHPIPMAEEIFTKARMELMGRRFHERPILIVTTSYSRQFHIDMACPVDPTSHDSPTYAEVVCLLAGTDQGLHAHYKRFTYRGPEFPKTLGKDDRGEPIPHPRYASTSSWKAERDRVAAVEMKQGHTLHDKSTPNIQPLKMAEARRYVKA